ncbi:MAG TPA: septum formation protein Maf [Clostridiales bacterium]|nr:septum formation protein Maf [Clostridiales bacterium]
MNKELILASGSKTRRKYLEEAGIPFKVIISDIDEITDKTDLIESLIDISDKKATSVAENLKKGIVIGIDTNVIIDGESIGKPKDYDEAVKILNILSGNINVAVSGVTILDVETGKKVSFAESTKVHFRNLDEEEIKWYISNNEGILASAAYFYEGKGAALIEKIEGCYFNVRGLPLSRILDVLKNEFDYKI